MKSRKQSSLKVDKEIHAKIIRFKKYGLIKESIIEFTNNALKEKLDKINSYEVEKMVGEKLDEIVASMGRMSLRITNAEDLKKKVIRLEKKSHTPSRKTKRKK